MQQLGCAIAPEDRTPQQVNRLEPTVNPVEVTLRLFATINRIHWQVAKSSYYVEQARDR